MQDFADVLLSRREALRRLGLLGLSLTGAGAPLAACGGDDDNGGAATGSSTTAPASGAPSAGQQAEAVTFPGPTGELQGAYASPSDAKASVLVIHENRGLRPPRHVARRPAGRHRRARAAPSGLKVGVVGFCFGGRHGVEPPQHRRKPPGRGRSVLRAGA
ncbi:MAG: hypothetical protein M3179_01460 [Actinomycetota bacterium]|nr:hypothetical protein [Actinomycetota bacterium]